MKRALSDLGLRGEIDLRGGQKPFIADGGHFPRLRLARFRVRSGSLRDRLSPRSGRARIVHRARRCRFRGRSRRGRDPRPCWIPARRYQVREADRSTVFLGVTFFASPSSWRPTPTTPSATSPARLPPPPSPAAVVAADQLLITMSIGRTIASHRADDACRAQSRMPPKPDRTFVIPYNKPWKAMCRLGFDASAKDMYEEAEALFDR